MCVHGGVHGAVVSSCGGTRAVYAHNACYLCPRTFLCILVHLVEFLNILVNS